MYTSCLLYTSALGDYMVKVVTSSLSDVDCALLLVEPIPHVGGPEKALIDRIREEKIPCILCINKIDTVEPAELLPVIAAYNEVWDGFDAIIPISAHKGGGLDDLSHELQKYAQEGDVYKRQSLHRSNRPRRRRDSSGSWPQPPSARH